VTWPTQPPLRHLPPLEHTLACLGRRIRQSCAHVVSIPGRPAQVTVQRSAGGDHLSLAAGDAVDELLAPARADLAYRPRRVEGWARLAAAYHEAADLILVSSRLALGRVPASCAIPQGLRFSCAPRAAGFS
jgi:hypothetical protein